MRTILLAAAAAAAIAAPAFAEPIPRINIALVHDGREVAATTTLEDGGATLEAQDDGEFTLAMQSDLPADARLIAVVRREVWATNLQAGSPPRGGALGIAAMKGDTIEICLETLDGAGPVPAIDDIPLMACASETAHEAHPDEPREEFISDLNPVAPSPGAPPAGPAVADPQAE